jgi:hypothetical protein
MRYKSKYVSITEDTVRVEPIYAHHFDNVKRLTYEDLCDTACGARGKVLHSLAHVRHGSLQREILAREAYK